MAKIATDEDDGTIFAQMMLLALLGYVGLVNETVPVADMNIPFQPEPQSFAISAEDGCPAGKEEKEGTG